MYTAEQRSLDQGPDDSSLCTKMEQAATSGWAGSTHVPAAIFKAALPPALPRTTLITNLQTPPSSLTCKRCFIWTVALAAQAGFAEPQDVGWMAMEETSPTERALCPDMNTATSSPSPQTTARWEGGDGVASLRCQ